MARAIGAVQKRHAARAAALRVIHFSIQRDHLHLIVEAGDRLALSRGVRGLAAQVAKRVNDALGRLGQLFADRFHARTLTTPREVRNALVYVMLDFRKHLAPDVAPVTPPRAWLAAAGWRKLGRLRSGEAPARPTRPPAR